jgi:NADH-quinone oxidoreductase subunit H
MLNQTIWSTLLVFVVALIALASIPAMLVVERRGSAWMQRRSGPNRVGPWGLLQSVSDAIKLVFKEANMPAKAHKFLFVLAPALAVIPPFVALAVIPLGGAISINGRSFSMQAIDLNVGILFFLAITSLHVYSVLSAGWSSNNKFSLMGGLRSSSQMISYEIAIGIAIVSVVMTYGTLDLREIVKMQEAGSSLPAWGFVLQPLAFLILWVCSFAEANRLPFDLPEGESELVAGYHTEYSGLTFALFMLGEYSAMLASSAFLATLFLGGYNVPFISEADLLTWLNGVGLDFNVALLPPSLGVDLVVHVGSLALVAIQLVSLVAKTAFFMWGFVWVRWTLPRFRYDQLMDLGWKLLLPLGIVNVLGTMIVSFFLRKGA